MINYVLSNEQVLPATTCVTYTNAADDPDARTSRTPRTWTGCSPASTREHRTYDFETWQLPGRRGGAAAGRGRPASGEPAGAARQQVARRPAARRTARAAPRRTATRTATRRCSTRAACSRCSSGTSPATRRRWSREACGVPPEAVRAGLPRLITENSGRDRTTAFVYSRRLDAAHRRRAVHPHRGRSCSCCSATSAGPAAASWPCAGTPRSRAPPTSRRCSTCCPATCRCRTRTRHEDLDAYVEAREHGQGLLGRHGQLHGQPAQGVVGRRGHGGQRLLLRLPAAADRQPLHLRDGARPDRRRVHGLLPVRARTRRSARPTAGCSGSAWPTSTGWWSATCHDRERHVLEGRPGDRDRRDAHRGHRHRGLLPARRRAHREERLVHQHPADAAVAPRGGRAGRRRAQRPVVHLPPRPPDPGEAGRLRPTRRTGRCWTSPGTTRSRAARPSRRAEAVLAEING